MCQGRVEFESIRLALSGGCRPTAPAMERLRGWPIGVSVNLEADAIRVTPLGWKLRAAVAMVFDRGLQADARLSRAFLRCII